MIYDNIDRGVYDLSNDKSGIRVGNEQYSVKPEPVIGGGGIGLKSTGGQKLG